MSRFNFTEITLQSSADITQIMNNFKLIEANAALQADLTTLQSKVNTNTTNISGKAPTNHSSTATTYGVGTASNYGHCKVINNVTTASYTDGNALSAYQGKVLKSLIDTNKTNIATNTTNIATNKANIETNATNIATNKTNIAANATAIAGKAPTSHASSGTSYGVGTTANYGHCKIVNALTSSAYANGVVLSAYQGYILKSLIDTNKTNIDTNTSDIATNKTNIATNTTNIATNKTNIDKKAPISHASTATTYGVGTGDNYGHCKIINNLTTSSNTNGYALSAYQGKVLLDKINTNATNISGKAPTSHASTATTYGVGSTTNYGHCMTINNLTTSAHADGKALSAYQGYVLNNKFSNYTATSNLGALALKKYSYGTAAPSGGSNGDIYDQYF